jgi:hypothetical protein
MKVREVKLVEEQACDLHSFDGHDLLVELEELRVRVARAEEKRATKVGKLAALVIEAANTLMDLGMLPVREIPQNPKKAQDVLKAVGVILEHL